MKKHPIVCLAAAAAIMAVTAGEVSAQETYKIDVSLETSPDHLRNISMEKWASALNEKSGGRLKVTIFHGAKKYKGVHVLAALDQAAIDMGVPGHGHIAKYVPEFSLLTLPLAYGATRAQVHTLTDGVIGKELNEKIEEKLNVKVIGRYLDHGYLVNFFLQKRVMTHADIVGLKMRFAGGPATAERIKVFGATPTKIPWPDLPQALQRGLVDGFVSTHESIRSAVLWDFGVKYAYDDRQAFIQYVPMMSRKAWEGLPKDLQALIIDSWEATIDDVRLFAKQRHASARVDGGKHGITAIKGKPGDLEAMRKKLLAAQPAIVETLKIDKDFVARAQAVIEKAK